MPSVWMVLNTSDIDWSLRRSDGQVQQDRHCNANAGERRLPACSFRQLAEKLCERSMQGVFATRGTVVGKLPTTTGWQPVLPGTIHRTSTLIGRRWLIMYVPRSGSRS